MNHASPDTCRRPRRLLAGLAVAAALLTALTARADAVHATVSPKVSPHDDRHYRALTLDNGLSVLLVSDPEADKAAAS